MAIDFDTPVTFTDDGFPAVFCRSPYNYDTDKESDLTALECNEESLTQQQFAADADINTIVRRFGLTGELPENPNPPVYADFDDIFDFQTAHNAVIAANARFMAFPAELRARFSNSPQQLVEFLADPGNRDEAIAIGLLPKPTVQAAAVQAAAKDEKTSSST